MRITFSSSKYRKKPSHGDRKIIKGVEHVRKIKMLDDPIYGRCADYSNGRYHYEWVPVNNT